MGKTQNEILAQVTREYLAKLDLDQLPSPMDIERELIDRTNHEFSIENTGRDKLNRIQLLKTLSFSQIAQVMMGLHRARRIAPIGVKKDEDNPLVGAYDPATGLYSTSDAVLKNLARKYDDSLSLSGAKEVLDVLRTAAPWVTGHQDKDMVAVNNGIFNYKTKELIPFDPKYVFLMKSAVDFDPTATSPVISMPDGVVWEIEEWMESLSDDPEIVHLLWEIIGAVLRNGVAWGKAAFFYSEKGNNGKGTLLEMMRNLTGEWADLPLDKFKGFLLERLIGAQAILTDENSVGKFLEDTAEMKAIITHDAITIARKYKSPVSYQFWGFMVQCMNEQMRSKDKSESYYRRQLWVPFTKWFGGAERKYIKNDYLNRPEVLRYVLKRVLVDMPDYYELSEPAACKALLEEHKTGNDPIREFWEEFADRFNVDFLPVEFLHELYVAWCKLSGPSGTPKSKSAFMKQLDILAKESGEWVRQRENNGVDTKRYDASVFNGQSEPLIVEYELTRWSRNGGVHPRNGNTVVGAPMTKLRGLVRLQPAATKGSTGSQN